MPVHDWTLIDHGIFHSFHTTWIAEINTALNRGLLPDGYYALAEQHAGKSIADLLTLHASPENPLEHGKASPVGTGGTLLADAPPRVRRRQTVVANTTALQQRTVAIRHVSGHELVALIEIISPANKDRAQSVQDFAAKAVDALREGIHLLVIDLFPPGKHDPYGIHGVISQRLSQSEAPYDLPVAEPMTLAAYSAGDQIEAYIEHLAVGARLVDMPLFLRPDRYINSPLESTYASAYAGMPAVWRDVLERPATTSR